MTLNNFVMRISRQALIIIVLMAGIKNACSQDQSIINLDYPTGLITNSPAKIPFDKKFTLIVENVLLDNIQDILLYEVRIKNGERNLFEDRVPDYYFTQSEYKLEEKKLMLNMPAIKPSRSFDILIIKRLSDKNIDRIDKLANSINQAEPFNMVNAEMVIPPEIYASYLTLYDSVTNNKFDPPRSTFPNTFKEYYENIYLKTIYNYNAAAGEGNYKKIVYYTKNQLEAVGRGLVWLKKYSEEISLLEKIFHEELESDLSFGYVSCTNFKKAKAFSLTQRIQNLNSSIAYFKALEKILDELAATNHDDYRHLRNKCVKIIEDLEYNNKEIGKFRDPILLVVSGVATESVWVSGNTNAENLSTKGSSILTLDAGVTNILARNLNNKIVSIPKTYWGINIYFRSVNKDQVFENLPSKASLRRKTKDRQRRNTKDNSEPRLLSHKNIGSRLCLTLGVTIGSIDKKNFGDFFGNTSFLAGPSYRFTRSFRVSAGASFVKRLQANPLITDKKIYFGSYVSLSLDIDLLGSISKGTSLLFK